MASTQSWAFPNLFDVSRNRINILEDAESVANRCKLLILTGPKELYNSIDFGVGLKQYLFNYNTDNQKAIIKDAIIYQLQLHEPFVDANKTQFADGLILSGTDRSNYSAQEYDKLKMSVSLSCVFGGETEVELNNE